MLLIIKLKKPIIFKQENIIQINLVIHNLKKNFKKSEKLIKYYLIQDKEKFMIQKEWME